MEALKDDGTKTFQDAGMIEFNIFLEQCKGFAMREKLILNV
jgi:hypothetical protein